MDYGKGKVIWSSATIENDERENFKDIFANIVRKNISRKICVDASKYVEVILFKDGEDFYLNLFDLNFAQDLVERKFTISVDGDYEIIDIATDKMLVKNQDIFNGSFTKYCWLALRKK